MKTRNENKKEYLRRILKVTADDYEYPEMDTYMREYNNFIKAFNFDETRGGEIEKIFIEFHSNGITPAKLVELQKGRKKLEEQLVRYNQKAKNYYEKEIKGKYYDEIVKTRFPKDAMIELQDLERNHSLIGNLSDMGRFITFLDDKWQQFIGELYITVDLVFNGCYEDGIIRIDEFDKVVEEEISYYKNQVREYEKSFDHEKIYYVGKNENPYKNIFLYCMNAYIKRFYPINIVTIKPGAEGKLVRMSIPEQKDKYTLEDVAKAYSEMSGDSYEKSYGKIKQQFRKSQFMQHMKNRRFYEFPNIEVPLATYVYYSKKNHVEPEYSKLFNTYDRFIVHYYAPLLRANIRGGIQEVRSI